MQLRQYSEYRHLSLTSATKVSMSRDRYMIAAHYFHLMLSFGAMFT